MFFWKKKKNEIQEQKRAVWGIKKNVLNLIFEVAKETHPNEFSAILKAEEGVINEIMLLPGTIQGDSHAILFLNNAPFDIKLRNVGIVHSHPSYSNKPSLADLQMFSHFGNTNIIVAYPYNENTWKCYDLNGNVVKLEVIDE